MNATDKIIIYNKVYKNSGIKGKNFFIKISAKIRIKAKTTIKIILIYAEYRLR